MNDYNRYSSVSDMLHNLNWQPLQLRHRISRLQMLYAAVHNTNSTVNLTTFLIPTSYPTRNNHQYHYIILSAQTNAYQTSFYPRTIKDWNQLPTHIIECNNLQSFLSQLTNYIA